MRHYLSDEPARVACGARSRQWMLKHHSKAIVAQKMQDIVGQVAGDSRPSAGFDLLRQQKLALRQAARPWTSTVPAAARSILRRSAGMAAGLRRLRKPWRAS